MSRLVLILHNIRSSHNVGSIFRSADAFGVTKIYLSGYTPYPVKAGDHRLPHLAAKINKQIAKTALGAEEFVSWDHFEDIDELIEKLKSEGFKIIVLEQTVSSTPVQDFLPDDRTAVIVGREVEGVEPEVLSLADQIIEIPMYGQKESLNVAVAAGIAMYELNDKRNRQPLKT